MTLTNENDKGMSKEIPKERYLSPYGSIIMVYQKVINLLDNTWNQPSKFRTKNWVEINDDSHGTYNTNSEIKFKTSMLRSSLCNYMMHKYLQHIMKYIYIYIYIYIDR